jgi:serine/threonine protein phosphatase 1
VRLHSLILEDKARRSAKRFVLVYLGDYIDRGSHSKEVIEIIINKPLEGFEILHLKGNHEHAMLQFIDHQGKNPAWLFWGGLATLASYGVKTHGQQPEDMAQMLKENLPAHHRAWLDALPYSHTEGDYLFVHAGIRPNKPIGKQAPEDMMMIRDEFFHSELSFEKAVVFGHTVFDVPLVMEDRIGIDTGAYATGVLTALVLQGMSRGFIQTGT